MKNIFGWIRCGIMQFVDVNNCSLSDVLSVARTDQMCEIYSPAKVEYYADGSRKVIPHQVSVYNTDAKFGCYSLINRQQAANLFPQYADIFERLPQESKFLCSPEGDKIRFANQEKGEIGFSFNAVDTEIDDVAFYLGNLRPTFQYVAREIETGHGREFCEPDRLNELNYLNSKLGVISGGEYPYPQALELATEADLPAVKSTYIQQGFKGKENFTILIDGHFVDDDAKFNQLVVKDGEDIKLCMPPAVYRSWAHRLISLNWPLSIRDALLILMKMQKQTFLTKSISCVLTNGKLIFLPMPRKALVELLSLMS